VYRAVIDSGTDKPFRNLLAASGPVRFNVCEIPPHFYATNVPILGSTLEFALISKEVCTTPYTFGSRSLSPVLSADGNYLCGDHIVRILPPFVSLVCLITGWEITATTQPAHAGDQPTSVTHVRSIYVNTDWQDPLVERTRNLGNFYWMPQSGETDTIHGAKAHAVIRTSRTKPQAIHAPLPQPVAVSESTATAKRPTRTSTFVAAAYKRNIDSTAVALSYTSPANDPAEAAQLMSTPVGAGDSVSSHARVHVKGEVVKATKTQVQPLKARALKLQ
jgi:hypothetical protein